MSTANPIIQGQINARDPAAVRKAVSDLAALIDEPINSVYATAGTQTGNERTVTFQVRDRRKNVRTGRQFIACWASATSDGAPSSSPLWDVPSAGTEQSNAADIHVYLTDDEGKAVVAIQSSAATLYFSGIWLGRPTERPLVWA